MVPNGVAAVTEFEKLIDHRGIVVNFPLGSLAHLQLARAYALSGDAAKAKTAFNDFFKLWKDGDSDIPILKEAKAEYTKLQGTEQFPARGLLPGFQLFRIDFSRGIRL